MRTIGFLLQPDHPRIRYTVAFLANHPLCRAAGFSIATKPQLLQPDITIAYGQKPEGGAFDLFIPSQHLFAETAAGSGPVWPNAYTYEDQTLFSVETIRKEGASPALKGRHFQFDLLEAIFFHISRYEEVFAAPEDLDEVGWLLEKDHFLVRHQLEKQAVADQLAATFFSVLAGRSLDIPGTYDLTHDIDVLYRFPNPYKFFRSLAGSIYRRQGLPALRQSTQLYWNMLLGRARDPFDYYDRLLSPLPSWTRKTLYFMAGGETRYDNFYRIDHPKIPGIIAMAKDRGYDIGFHPSYNAAFKLPLYRREKQRLEHILGHPIFHNRQHWLRFSWAVTPHFYGECGIREDASLGYRRRLGFRCGTGFPYQLYDFQSEKAFEWLERPLAFMESSAIHESARTGQDLSSLMKGFLTANSQNTHISFNFHNSSFDPTLANGRTLKHFYEKELSELITLG